MTFGTFPRRTEALIAALTLLVGALVLCVDRSHSGDMYLQIFSGRFIANHGLIGTDPFPTIAHGQQWLNQQWLSELAFYRTVQAVGITGLTIIYAALIAAPLAMLLWLCRNKGTLLMILVSAFYFPGLLAVIHPRAAGFTVFAFCLLVALISIWHTNPSARWPMLAIPILFVVWANVHGGFVAGLLLIAVTTLGLAIDRARGLRPLQTRRIALLSAAGALAFAAVSLATPLSIDIWQYMNSFRSGAISLVAHEWESSLGSPAAMLYLGLATIACIGLWLSSPAPRAATPLLVAIVFIVFALSSERNILFVGPVLALLVAWSCPERTSWRSPIPVAVFGGAAAVALVLWVAVFGVARNEGPIGAPAVDYALAHPPPHGHILTYAGVGSYMLWRSPTTPVVLNGWLEHFNQSQICDAYGVLRGWDGDPRRRLRRLRVGAVIAHLPVGIKALQRHGFVPVFTDPDGTYLVRRKYLRGSRPGGKSIDAPIPRRTPTGQCPNRDARRT